MQMDTSMSLQLEVEKEQRRMEEEAQKAKDLIAAEPRKVSPEDRQMIEILYLKIENLKLQERVLQGDLIKASAMRASFQKELLGKGEEFKAKYGMVLGRDQVLPDGTIVPQNGVAAIQSEPAKG